MRFFRIAALALTLFLPAAAFAQADLALLVYMTGSDLESRGGCASRDLSEMAAALPADGSVSVAVLAGGAASWESDVPADGLSLLRITPEGPVREAAFPAGSMGDPETLSRFLKEAALRFPARRYALVFWDHGGGPLLGVCFDENTADQNGMDSLSLDEIASALAASPFASRPLSFIGFDACLMASLEVARCVSPYAEVMIASQEPEPASGWDYAFLPDLPACGDAAAMGACIVSSYAASLAGSLAPCTLSCADLSQTESVCREVEALFSASEPLLLPESYNRFARCRLDAKTLASAVPADYDLVDLYDLTDVLMAEGLGDAAPLHAALDRMILSQTANEEYVHGLSIYHPFDNKNRYRNGWGFAYDALPFLPAYRQFLSRFSHLWLGESLSAWSGAWLPDAREEGALIRVSMTLAPEESQAFAEARLLILEEIADGEYRMLCQQRGARPDGSLLTADYGGEALYITDEAGSVLAGPLSYRAVGDGIAIGAVLDKAEWTPGSQQSVYLMYREDAEGRLAMTGICAYHDGIGMFVPSALRLEEYDSVTFAGWARVPGGEDEPFESWSFGTTVSVECIPLSSLGRPAFLRMPPEGGRFARIEVTDLQGAVHASSLVPLPGP